MAASARHPNGGSSQVDDSPGDFRRAKAAIEDAAVRQQRRGMPDRLRRVRQHGDTTVITEHRDPYSFYWQLDKLRKAESAPPKAHPPADYVLEEHEEEEEVEEEEEQWPVHEESEPPPTQQFLSPDSGVHLPEREEANYARPVKVAEEDPAIFSHYWHVDSGPRRQEPPPISRRPAMPEPPAVFHEPEQLPLVLPAPPREPVIEEHAFRQTTTKRRVELAEERQEEGGGQHQAFQFKVRYLGQLELAESELEGVDRSQQALNRAMARLANNTGRDVLLELCNAELRVFDPPEAADGGEGKSEPLIREPVKRIRCWAVGSDNPREFAFVAREPGPKGRLLCHVFRCEDPAKQVADALDQACAQLLQQQKRPDSLGSLGRRRTRQSVPFSPMEEPKRVLRCHFIGVTQVPRATGIEVLNEAVDRLLSEVHRESWTLVEVHISPSAIVIFEARGPQREIARARLRYVSFLGIGRDVKHCAFIVAQSADHFICYVFHAEPSAAPLAKTIEAACKLRYQKVLDAHLGDANGPSAAAGFSNKPL